MKKLSALFLSALFILSLTACDLDLNLNQNPATDTPSVQEDIVSNINSQNNSSADSGNLLTREEAIKIALDHAKLEEKDVINLTAELDREMSHNEWEVEFDKDGYEYSYEIDASSGKIIKNEKEID